jgi:hypothetical protein
MKRRRPSPYWGPHPSPDPVNLDDLSGKLGNGSDRQRAYREANNERIAAKRREWAKNNPDKVREYRRRYERTHREEHNETSRRYYAKHKAEIAARHRAYREANKERLAENRKIGRDTLREVLPDVYRGSYMRYRDVDRTSYNAKARDYYARNRDRINAAKRARRANKT